MRYLVDKAKPGANVRDIGWPGEVTYGIEVLGERFHIILGDEETSKLNLPLAELKLLWIHYNTIGTN